MNVSLAFTTWNSAEWIKQQLARDYFTQSSNLIDEIIIQDDYSNDYQILQNYQSDKVKLYQNELNLSPLLSREKLVENCKNDWVLLMDSDNFLRTTSEFGDRNCFDVIKALPLHTNTIYCPGFRGHWGYNNLRDKRIDLAFVREHFHDPSYYMQMFLNTGNYFVPKRTYLEICKKIDKSYSHFTVDVVYFNYLWLASGNFLHCISDYEYDHTIRNDSFSFTHGDLSKQKLQTVHSFFTL
jgi:hypothetical protein